MNTTINVQKEYLVLPVSVGARTKRLWISCDGKMVDTVDLRLGYLEPTFQVYYPIGQYKGQEITLSCEPEMELQDWQADTPDYHDADAYPFRPQWHFTPRFGWMNDPNGLVAYTSPVSGQTTYHMFFQYNPYDTIWGNMHWGHAVSNDLLHWEERPVAICPDEGGTIFSGCGIVDTENLTGLQEGEEKVILLYYSVAAGFNGLSVGKTNTQCIAYSTDGGNTFRKWQGNPVVPQIGQTDHDPKVIWCEELKRYVMALYLGRGGKSEYVLFTSEDLLHWERLQEIWIDGEMEVPDLYPLTVPEEPGKRYWVFTGGKHNYMLCTCSPEEGFRIVQGSRPLAYGITPQAPQTFSNMPDGRRICIYWQRDIRFPAPCLFAGQQSIPYEMTLRKYGAAYYLAAWPIKEIASLYQESSIYRHFGMSGKNMIKVALEPAAYDIFLNLPPGENGRVTMVLFGGAVVIDAGNNTVTVENGSIPSPVMPLSKTRTEKSLRILVDRCSLELFSDRGTSVMCVSFVCDYNLGWLEVSSRDGAMVEQLDVHRLKDRAREK